MKKHWQALQWFLVFTGYLLLCGGVVAAVAYFRLPLSTLLLLVLPILWASLFFPFALNLSLLGALFLISVMTVRTLLATPEEAAPLIGAAAGAGTAAVVMLSWVSQRRRSERAELQAEKELFRKLAEYAADFEFLLSPAGEILYASPSSVRVTGYANTSFLRQPDLLWRIVHPADREAVQKCLEHSVDEYSKPLEFSITHADGSERILELSTRQIYGEDGEYRGKRGSLRDITSRKRLEDSLFKSITRLRLAFEGTGDGVWDWDLSTGVMEISPNYARLLDLKTTRLPDHGAMMLDRIHHEDVPALARTLTACREGNFTDLRLEYRIQVSSGEWRWILSRGRVVRRQAENNLPLRMVGTFQDITELKQTTDALRHNEEILRQITENMSEFFWVADLETHRMLYLSPSFKTLWGYSLEQAFLPGFAMEELFDPKDRQRFLLYRQELIKKGVPSQEEFRIRRADGVQRWVSMRSSPIFNAEGRVYRLCGFCEDITARKEAESALQRSEARYRELVEKQGEGVLILSQQQTILFSNPASDHLFGVSDGSLAGRNLQDFLIMDEEHTRGLQEHNVRLAQGQESSIELSIERPDQTRRNILVTATPRFDREGSFDGSICIFRDITQRKQKEEELRYLSMHDALTGLFNRAYFEMEIVRLEQSDLYPISIIIADLDNLKAINDSYGHAVGDEMLVRAAGVLKRSLRRGDVVARIGGDEFAVLLPASGENVLQEVIDRVHENLVVENLTLRDTRPLGISIGGATSYHQGSLRAVLTQADVQMYLQKSSRKLS